MNFSLIKKDYWFLILVYLFFSEIGQAQFGYPQVIDNCMLYPRVEPQLGDIDGDGDLDLFLGGVGTTDLNMWFKNIGEGNFLPQKRLAFNLFPEVKLVDFDGDADLDIVGVNFTSDIRGLTWYQNNGNGVFASLELIISSPGIASYALKDWDNDSDLDVFCNISDGVQHRVIVFRNNGNGNFSNIQVLNELEDALYLFKGDLDNDGQSEILLHDENYIIKLIGNPDFEEFSLDTIYDKIESPYFGFVQDVQVVDYDNNGINDISWLRNDSIHVLVGEGQGLFSANHQRILYTEDAGTLEYLDLDEDGDLDLLTYESFSLSSNWGLNWYRNENGLFNYEDVIGISQVPTYSVTMHLDDNDQLDVLSGSYHSKSFQGNYQFCEPDQSNPLDTICNYSPGRIRTCYNYSEGYVLDFDGDGRRDLLAKSDDDFIWSPNIDGQGFLPRLFYDVGNGSGNHLLGIQDFNADGRDDLLLWVGDDAFNGSIRYVQYENGSFLTEPLLVLNPPERYRKITVVDYDEDEDFDVGVITYVLGSGNDEELLRIFKNDGNGNFVVEGNIDIAVLADDWGNLRHVYLANLDGEHNAEIVFQHNEASTTIITYSKNLGGYTYADDAIRLDSLTGSVELELRDWDGDGDIDVMIAHDLSSSLPTLIGWYENNGLGQFSEKQILFELEELYSYLYVDVDADGRLDVVTYRENQYLPYGVYWYKQIEDGTTAEAEWIFDLRKINNIFFSDFDGDSDQDFFYLGEDEAYWQESLFGSPLITGRVFLDTNENAIFDPGEILLPGAIVDLEPSSLFNVVDGSGNFRFYTNPGEYQLTAEVNDCWGFTTESTYNVNLDDNGVYREFGVRQVMDYTDGEVYVSSGFTRCGFEAAYELLVENTGCDLINGELRFVVDPLLTFLESTPSPDEVSGDTLIWQVEELFSGAIFHASLVMQVAGVEELGETIQSCAFLLTENESNSFLSLIDSFCHASVINCAYDPNDKNVQPDRSAQFDENYTLFEEDLLFTVRFQNTGTDTAFTVIIEDELDTNLDINSFRPLYATHAFEAEVDRDSRMAKFIFRNIDLPDSTTNYSGSQGQVIYRIKSLTELEENTTILNEASIYFDYNPPIITNKTKNVLVSELPGTNAISQFQRPDVRLEVYPNPSDGTFSVVKIGAINGKLLTIYDEFGRIVHEQSFSEGKVEVSSFTKVAGVYSIALLGEHRQLISYCRLIRL